MAKRDVFHGGKPGAVQQMGSVVGRRGAGITSITPGDPLMHSFNNYGKGGPGPMGGAMADAVAGIMTPASGRSLVGSSRRMRMMGEMT